MASRQKVSPNGKKAVNGSGLPQVESWAIDRLVPYQGNARTHSEAQVAQIAASIKAFGFNQPILVNRKEGILAGHGRLLAGRLLEMAEVPVIVLDHLTAKQQRAFILADNRIAMNAGWDEGMLASELKALAVEDFDLGSLGFDEAEIERLIPKAVVEDDPGPLIDRAAELQVKWKTARGQVWEIGRHRLMCGDCTVLEDVAVLLNGAKPFLMVTDPPYGVDYDPAWRTKAAEEGHLAYAASRVGTVPNDDRSDWKAAWDLFPGDVVYSWHPAGATSLVHAKALQDSGFVLRMQIIWAKSNFPIGRGDYHVRHEPCWYAVRKGKPALRTDDRTQTTLWEINLDHNVEGGHSTQKPVECMARPMRNHDCEDVYDPFVGSGTTIVAAEQLNRVSYSMEIAPPYVAVCLERLSDMDLKPRLAK